MKLEIHAPIDSWSGWFGSEISEIFEIVHNFLFRLYKIVYFL